VGLYELAAQHRLTARLLDPTPTLPYARREASPCGTGEGEALGKLRREVNGEVWAAISSLSATRSATSIKCRQQLPELDQTRDISPPWHTHHVITITPMPFEVLTLERMHSGTLGRFLHFPLFSLRRREGRGSYSLQR
jgi:hypothetical protein